MTRSLSIVVPLLNEAETIAELHRQLSEVAKRESYALQIIFIDDGSTDNSWEVISELAKQDGREEILGEGTLDKRIVVEGIVVEGIRFRGNFGKAAALAAGFKAATAPYVITMDADLQDDPDEIPQLIAKLEGKDQKETFDVASGWKQNRQDPWHKTIPSKFFNFLVSRLTKVSLHDHNCGLKAYRGEVLKEIDLYGELHRFIPVLAAAKGFRVTEVPVHHRPREHGYSKYGASRIIKGLLDLVTVKFLTGYGDRPQHLLGGFGLMAFTAGSVGLLYLAVRWLVTRLVPGLEPIHLHETASLFYSLALCLVGSQFLSVGLLAAMLAAFHTKDALPYSIQETTQQETT